MLHYLDGFLFLASPNSSQGRDILSIALRYLVAVHKTEGPTALLVFLGILSENHWFELHLKAYQSQEIDTWVDREMSCTKKELAIPAGTSFTHSYGYHTRMHIPTDFILTPAPCLCTTSQPTSKPERYSRHQVVVHIFECLEWQVILSSSHSIHRGDIRCIRVLWLWRLLKPTWLVPSAVVRQLE